MDESYKIGQNFPKTSSTVPPVPMTNAIGYWRYDGSWKLAQIYQNGGLKFFTERVNYFTINLIFLNFIFRVVEKVKYFSGKDPGIISAIL